MISCLLELRYEEGVFSPRGEAIQNLRFALRHGVSEHVLGYLTELGTQQDTYRLVVVELLQGTDHPIAVRYVARELGLQDHEARQRQSFSSRASQWRTQWERDHDNRGPGLSRESIQELRLLWEDCANPDGLRDFAFWVWARYVNDLAALKAIPSSSPHFQPRNRGLCFRSTGPSSDNDRCSSKPHSFLAPPKAAATLLTLSSRSV
jgi:hypothetical protein